MSDAPTDDADRQGGLGADWRSRYDPDRDRGVALDPRSDPVPGVHAYPTDYAPDRLLVTRGDLVEDQKTLIEAAAADFGWEVALVTLDDEPTEVGPALERARSAWDQWGLPTIYRFKITVDLEKLRGGVPVPPVDAWRLLQRLRARSTDAKFAELQGISLEHVLSVSGFTGKTLPFGGKTLGFTGKTLANQPGVDSYAQSGTGGRQVVSFVGAAPARSLRVRDDGRRAQVVVFDTGCGKHGWLDPVVTRYPSVDGSVIGFSDPATDPEVHWDQVGPYEGQIDPAAGHGTFVSGIVRQLAPEADIIAVRIADSEGTVLEGPFLMALRALVKWMLLPDDQGGKRLDVLNLSLGFYHETPDEALFDPTMAHLLAMARSLGCAVVCSAGNDATDRPAFPAALWQWPGVDFVVEDPTGAAPHLAVGALNPNGTMALFSNLGPWVTTYAPGASVLSTQPPFRGGMQAGSRDDREGMVRETLAPEDYRGGFAIWSGTSFAAPYVAGLLARALSKELGRGPMTLERRITLLDAAAHEAHDTLAEVGPTMVTGVS